MDLNAVAQSLYNVMKQLNNVATSVVGLDCLWMRCVPYENSEDVIIQEYTLLNVDCPKAIKVTTTNSGYNPGNFQIDMFGLNYEAPLEINIDIDTWQSVYGNDLMPQKDDIVYIKMLNKLYEVQSATIIYGIAEKPTGYKCQLVKYNPKQSRKESEDLQETIKDMTVSQQDLFGEHISNEVADIVDPVEFGLHNTTIKDPFKSFDIDAIKEGDIIINSNIIANSYYSFINSSVDVVYNANAEYDNSMFWIYSCVFRLNENEQGAFDNVEIELYNKNQDSWLFVLRTYATLEVGQNISLKRGKSMSINAKVASHIKDYYLIEISVADCLRNNKKLKDWYTKKGWRISEVNPTFNLLTGKNDKDKVILSFDVNNNQCLVSLNSYNYTLQIPNKIVDVTKWCYLNICFGGSQMIFNIKSSKSILENNIVWNDDYYKQAINISSINDLNVNEFSIDNANKNIDLCNIRLYETETPISEKQLELDSNSQNVRNASKTIIVDMPNIHNKMNYISITK